MTFAGPAVFVWTAVLDTQGRVLLGQRSGSRYADGLWNLPGGGAEVGEDLRRAAAREVLEEVGLEIKPSELTSLGVSRFYSPRLQPHSGSDSGSDMQMSEGVSFLFAARRWQGEPCPLDKTAAVCWADPAQLPDGCLPWLPEALRLHLLQGVRLSQQRHTDGAVHWDVLA